MSQLFKTTHFQAGCPTQVFKYIQWLCIGCLAGMYKEISEFVQFQLHHLELRNTECFQHIFGSFVLHLLVGFWWDQVWNWWDGSHQGILRRSYVTQSVSSIFFCCWWWEGKAVSGDSLRWSIIGRNVVEDVKCDLHFQILLPRVWHLEKCIWQISKQQ